MLRAAGTNCDAETAYAFSLVGAEPTVMHVNALRAEPSALQRFQVLAIPGGFSYGDDVASGRIFANELMSVLRDELLAFNDRGGFAIGICNGFQVLVKAGLLPRLGERGGLGAQGIDMHDGGLGTDQAEGVGSLGLAIGAGGAQHQDPWLHPLAPQAAD